ncbi:MAG: ABC transporter substrate-binding protein [Chloroflexi bacterium]|nr:ABC transporter substrate-binding protein [Chloroflexota bacterium]
MLKRFALLTLAIVLAVALLPQLADNSSTAVAQDEEVWCGTDEEVTVTLIAGSVGQEGEIARQQLDRWAEVCPNVSVDLVARPDSATETLGQYQQFFEAESSEIDVYQIDVIWPGILAEHLVDLNEYLDEEVVEAHFPAIIQNNTVDGRLVGIPWFTDAGLLYYRTDLLEKYELDPPETWTELEEAARTIQEGERAEGNEDFWGFVWQGNAYEGLTCDALEWQFSSGGGEIITPDGVIEVNNPETIAIFEQASGWVGDISPEGVTTFMEEDARGVWQAGNAAFMRNWPYAYSLGQAEDSAIAGLFDVKELPGAEPGMSAATLGGWQLAVSRYSENVEPAVALAAFLASPEEQKMRAIDGSYNPTIADLYEDEDILEAAPFFGSLYDVFINAVPRPSTVAAEQYNDVSQLYYTAVHSILTGEADAQTAMEDLELQLADLGFEFPEE